MRKGRASQKDLAFGLDTADDSCLRSQSSVVGDGQMPCDSYLASDDAMAAYLRGAGYSGLCGHHRMFSDFHIVGYLSEPMTAFA